MSGYVSQGTTITLQNATNQLQLGNPAFLSPTTIISAAAPAATRTVTIPDAGANSNFVLSQGSQTVAGAQTFSSAVTITPTTNQLVLGTTNTTTLSATAPSASRVVTLPDPGANDSVAYLAATQSLSAKTVTGPANVVNLTTTASVTAGQSGTTFYIAAAGSAYTVSLPAVAAGLRYKFISTSSSLAAAVTIAATAAVVQGIVIAGDATAVASCAPIAAKTNVILGTGSKIGDALLYECDGTNWYVMANISVHTTITVS